MDQATKKNLPEIQFAIHIAFAETLEAISGEYR